jgi:uncharacterized membrane protein YgdD (TMEM256/DUF423 family)
VNRTLLTAAGTLGVSAVTLGAFGAHGLRDRLAPPLLEIYRTGVLYHLIHALAVLAVALAADRLRRPRLIAGLFTAGIAIFSGTLYLLAITGMHWLGAVTPIGGVLLIAGWAAILIEGFGRDRERGRPT